MLEDDLKALMTAPARREQAFTLAVMARIEKRQYHRALAARAGLALAAALLLALVMPALQSAWQVSFAPFASNLVIGMMLMLSSGLIAYQAAYKD